MTRRALITGITGQAGSYLAEFLLSRGYLVFGLVRRTSTFNFERIQNVQHRLVLLHGDLLDQASLVAAVEQAAPDEVYNLAAHSLTYSSWTHPTLALETTAVGVTRLLETVRQIAPRARFYQASSSECFGDPLSSPQNESSPFRPRNPYGIAKAAAHWTVVNYRQQYGLFGVCGILFNHESPRRGLEFVTRRISDGVARIKLGLSDRLVLGDLEARRDWGYAPDYVRAMWLMMQTDEPTDYVIGTGVTHSVRDFVERAFACVELDWREYVKVDEALLRPRERCQLVADPTRANERLDWCPKVNFKGLVELMVEADLKRLSASGAYA